MGYSINYLMRCTSKSPRMKIAWACERFCASLLRT